MSWLVGPRNGRSAYCFMHDLAGRLRWRAQLTSDGLSSCVKAVEDVFGCDVDFARLVKLHSTPGADEPRRYSPARCHGVVRSPVVGEPEPDLISTSFVERQNLNPRMGVRRFTRLTNAFSKKLDNHVHHVAPWSVWYNCCRRHATLRTTPAQAAGPTDKWHAAEWLVRMIDDPGPAPKKPGPPKGSGGRPRKTGPDPKMLWLLAAVRGCTENRLHEQLASHAGCRRHDHGDGRHLRSTRGVRPLDWKGRRQRQQLQRVHDGDSR